MTFLDTIIVRKKAGSLRYDFNIVGLSGLKAKKRKTSLLLNPMNIDPDIVKGYNKIFMVHHSKKKFTRPLNRISFKEKKLIMNDLLNSEPVFKDIKVETFSMSFLEDYKNKKIPRKLNLNGYSCEK